MLEMKKAEPLVTTNPNPAEASNCYTCLHIMVMRRLSHRTQALCPARYLIVVPVRRRSMRGLDGGVEMKGARSNGGERRRQFHVPRGANRAEARETGEKRVMALTRNPCNASWLQILQIGKSIRASKGSYVGSSSGSLDQPNGIQSITL